MSKLYFKHGVMGAGKSIEILKIQYSYKENGTETLLLKSAIDTRGEKNFISSRTGLCSEVILFDKEQNLFNWFSELNVNDSNPSRIGAILIDESQFMTKEQVEQLTEIIDTFNIPVVCVGLLTDFKSNLFEGSKRLIELADKIEEIKTICWCGKKAKMNARIVDGKLITEGEQIQIGGNESYTRLCRFHYKQGKLS
jgi:thymidine kinase